MKKIAIIAVTEKGLEKALIIQQEFPKSLVVTTLSSTDKNASTITSISSYLNENFAKLDGICFVSALGICVRLIARHLEDKNTDPAVISVDDLGLNVQSILSGHKGGANDFASKIATVLGAKPIISTSSDVQNIWALDTLGTQFDWQVETSLTMNKTMALFVNNKPTALLLDIKDKGTQHLEKTVPSFVKVFYSEADIDYTQFELCIVVSYKKYEISIPSISYIPKVLSVGSGCSKQLDSVLFENTLKEELNNKNIHFSAIKNFGSIDIKAKQQAYLDFAENNAIPFSTFTSEEIDTVTVPNPSEMVQSKIGVDGVSESSAILLSGNNTVLVEKQKIHLDNGEKFTFSVAVDVKAERRTAIAIIGAGPGDEELITVKGKQYLQEADCVLYAGSLVPEEMTNWCKPGAIVRNSAMMTLEEQVSIMQEHYKKGNSIVRLQSGDPSLYGAIQEQMTIFDELGMDYFIVPGIAHTSHRVRCLYRPVIYGSGH